MKIFTSQLWLTGEVTAYFDPDSMINSHDYHSVDQNYGLEKPSIFTALKKRRGRSFRATIIIVFPFAVVS